MILNTSVILTTGRPGSGKTYVRGALLVDELLREKYQIVTNVPLSREYYSGAIESGELTLIDIESWRSGEFGPWDYVAGYNHEGDTVIPDGVVLRKRYFLIDEFHRIWTDTNELRSHRWKRYSGEIRHYHHQMEFLTQDEMKIPIDVRRDVGNELCFTSEQDVVVFGVSVYDIMQLLSALSGRLISRCYMDVYLRGSRKRKKQTRRIYVFDKRVFSRYSSFSQVIAHPYEKGRLNTIWWFLKRNGVRLGSYLAIAGSLLYLVLSVYWAIPTVFEKLVGGKPKVALAAVNTDSPAGSSAGAGVVIDDNGIHDLNAPKRSEFVNGSEWVGGGPIRKLLVGLWGTGFFVLDGQRYSLGDDFLGVKLISQRGRHFLLSDGVRLEVYYRD